MSDSILRDTKLVLFGQVCGEDDGLTPLGIVAMFNEYSHVLISMNRMEMQTWLKQKIAGA